MSEYESFISMICHALLEKVKLSSAIRTIIFPQVPKISKLVMTLIESDSTFEFLLTHYYYIFTLIIFICLIFFKKKVKLFLKDSYDSIVSVYKQLIGKDVIEINGIKYYNTKVLVSDPSNVISIMRYISDNLDNDKLFELISIEEIEYKYHMTFKQKIAEYKKKGHHFNHMFTFTSMNSEFDKYTITLPKKISFKFFVPKDKFLQEYITINMSTECIKDEPIRKNDNEEDEDDSLTRRIAKKNIKAESSNLDVSFDDIKLHIELVYSGKRFNPTSFMNYFNGYVKDYIKSKYNEICISNKSEQIYKHFSNHKFISTIYNGPIIPVKDRIDIYMGSYIHQKADELRALVNAFMKDCEGDTFGATSSIIPYMSLLIYGPPGSGKSSIAERLAMALKRHIHTLDISHYSKLNNLTEKIATIRSKENIVLIDEIDKIIMKIKEDEESNLECIDESDKKMKDEKEGQELLSNEREYILLEDNSSPVIELSKILNGDNSKKEYKSKEDGDKPDKDKEIKNMIHNYNIPKRKFDYGVEDLLPLFDGTYQGYGSITIATTNNPEILLDVGNGNTKGALTRAGRLKPYRIGYFDSNTVKQLIDIKFGKEHDIQIPDEWYDENNEIKIQSSNFIDILKFATPDNFIELLINDMQIYENLYNN
jgi:energy-coupling factor transporter ATP-binding protein EcfA2